MRPGTDGEAMADHLRKFSDSSNGDQWFLGRDEAGRARVLHNANVPSGGMETHYEIGAFLARPHTPEAQDLLILIGALVGGADEFRGVRRDDEARL
jgi:hypothetical protein